MSIFNRFIDGSAGNDANDGKDNIGVGLATATWTESTFTLTQSGHGYTFSTGDVIAIESGTGATAGLYEVASSTSNDIVLVETSTLPTVDNASDFAAGDLASADIVSSDGPWATIDKAFNTVNVNEDQTMWIRATGTYTEDTSLDVVLNSLSETCTFEGYGTTLGDDSQITLAGILTDAVTGRAFYCFKNIIFDATSTKANCISFAVGHVTWRKCKFINATSIGVNVGLIHWFWDCDFNDNGNDGFAGGSMGFFVKCRFYRNGATAIDATSHMVCYQCDFFSNTGNGADGTAANDTALICLECTFDGDSKDGTTAVESNSSQRSAVAIINCIIYDYTEGTNANHGDRDLLLNNLFNNNTNDFDVGSRASDQEGTFQSGAPDFVDEPAGADYALNASSPAVGTGHDQDNNMDMGAHQRSAGGVGGGLLMPNKRAGKQ